mmetsp:Transcript_16763/g.51506  ORF Transcript_16763/g.51506 Transcript_16763/m.51506 type:complete len:218 (-) Transcript_16763:249-902(-)
MGGQVAACGRTGGALGLRRRCAARARAVLTWAPTRARLCLVRALRDSLALPRTEKDKALLSRGAFVFGVACHSSHKNPSYAKHDARGVCAAGAPGGPGLRAQDAHPPRCRGKRRAEEPGKRGRGGAGRCGRAPGRAAWVGAGEGGEEGLGAALYLKFACRGRGARGGASGAAPARPRRSPPPRGSLKTSALLQTRTGRGAAPRRRGAVRLFAGCVRS